MSAAHAELAALYEEANRLEELSEVVEAGLAIEPDHPRLNLEAAKCERRLGQFPAAIERLEGLDSSRMSQRMAAHYHFELGLLYDRTDDADSAYEHFDQANRDALGNERLRNIDPQRFLDKIQRLHEFFDRAEPESWSTPAAADPKSTPVFMFGFPRSGTTLAELILDSHPDIQTVEEQPTINTLERELLDYPGGYPGALAELTAEQLETLRQVYFKALDEYFPDRQPGRILVDKMPMRTVHAGLIWRLFPRARIILNVRHPCDVCLSGFMQQFSLNNDAFANFFSL